MPLTMSIIIIGITATIDITTITFVRNLSANMRLPVKACSRFLFGMKLAIIARAGKSVAATRMNSVGLRSRGPGGSVHREDKF